MTSSLTSFAVRVLIEDGGATAIEYGLIGSLIAVAAIVGMQALGVRLDHLFTGISEKMTVPQ